VEERENREGETGHTVHLKHEQTTRTLAIKLTSEKLMHPPTGLPLTGLPVIPVPGPVLGQVQY